MKIGLDVFSIRDLQLDEFKMLDYAKRHGFQGVQFGTLEPVRDAEIHAYANSLGLYSDVSVPACNPHLVQGSLDEHISQLERHIKSAAKCGRHELHSSLGGLEDRFSEKAPWPQQLQDSADLLRKLAPILRNCGSRINLETHGDTTTFELVRMAEDIGPDAVGICLDTANMLCMAEDPVAGARRAAPYTHMTHIKDAITFFIDGGYRRQTLPPGRGALDWRQILPILAEHSPDLRLSIEDHKWLFDFPVFDPQWLSFHPDLTREEFASVMKLTWQCHQRILAGDYPDPHEYEKIPQLDELDDRLIAGRDYLRKLLEELDLR